MDEHIYRIYSHQKDQDKRLEEIERRLDDLEAMQPDPEDEIIEQITDVKYPTGGPGG